MSRLLREYIGLNYNAKIIEEAKKARVEKQPIVVPALLQRASAVNQNGRVYPREILEREVENYKKAVVEGRSGGQLDHPDCNCEGNQILTRDGWKDFKNISDNEYVYTLNTKTQQIELKRINKKINQPYKGLMYEFKGRNIKNSVTPNHRFWLIDRYGQGSFVTAKEIFDNRKKYSKHHIPKVGLWIEPEKKDTFILDGCSDFSLHNSKTFKNKNCKDVEIDINVWSSFVGLYLAEGNCSNRVNKFQKYNYKVKITQKHEKNKQKIRELLSKFPDEIEWKEKNYGDGKVDFFTHDKRLHSYLSPLGKSYEKYIPFELKQLSSSSLQNILDWFVLGDGRIRECNGYFATEVFSTSKRLIEDLNEILLKTSVSGNVHIRKPYDREIEGRLIKEENQRDLYFLHFSTTKGVYLHDDLEISPIQYDGNVYCVSVPNETFYCMDPGGKTYWSGNSSIVELQNVSHKIKKIWWEGEEVMGLVEIHPALPKGMDALGLLEAGLKVGISSRGVGETIQNESGHDVVDESFMLVAFDLVSEPSTQEAWLMREGKEVSLDMIRQMVPKVDRCNRIINEILGTNKSK